MKWDKDVAQTMPLPHAKRPSPPPGFREFYREKYKPLLRAVMCTGASHHQADDAVASAMEEVLRRVRCLDLRQAGVTVPRWRPVVDCG